MLDCCGFVTAELFFCKKDELAGIVLILAVL